MKIAIETLRAFACAGLLLGSLSCGGELTTSDPAETGEENPNRPRPTGGGTSPGGTNPGGDTNPGGGTNPGGEPQPQSGVDPFGITKMYPTKAGGEEWYMNMDNPEE